MADVIQTVQFKRGSKADLEAVLVGNNILLAGEPAYETDTGKLKVGNGTDAYANLPYVGDISAVTIFIEGYYLNGEFYTDSSYQTLCEHNNQKIYVNKNFKGQDRATNFIDIYRYCGTDIGYVPIVAEASDFKPGLVKLYNEHGKNTDGTMTQKVITEGIDQVILAVSSEDSECLVLNKPW